MLKTILIGSLLTTASALALPAYACGFHGGGFGNVNWQPYNPRASYEDPALLNKNYEETSLITPIPAEKARPSFSNAANRAALIAKARLAKKTKDQEDKSSKDVSVKKTASNTDR